MERFVQFLIIGGLGLITGLWATSFAFPDTLPWIGGIVLSILSVSSLIFGIATGLNQ